MLTSRKELKVNNIGSGNEFYKKNDPLVYKHLMERDPKSWYRTFFKVVKDCDAFENGISESSNSVIDLARKRPFLTMLEEIQIYAMKMMYKILLEGQSWGNLKICPSIILKISKLKKHQRLIELVIFMEIFWGVIPSGIQKYKVRLGNDGYVVNLTNKTCGCRSWQVSGIPCVHVVATISYLNRNAEDYVAPWFHTAISLHEAISSLKKRRLPRRPTLKRKRDQSERESKGKTRYTISKAGVVMRCTICRENGHNRSTCPTRSEDVASTSRPKKKKAKKCKKEKACIVESVQVEPVQVEPIQLDDPTQPVDGVQVDDHDPQVDVQVDDPTQLVNDVPAQPVATGKRIQK
uniref:SWIM-type domain-containing protein n=1 Tax=Lactuca sativa TaxID=4236 RepID=A0A9R1XTA6_LACSA|nr:hypothetical protein LSAT_V11C100006950 [Lactuca sativa]